MYMKSGGLGKFAYLSLATHTGAQLSLPLLSFSLSLFNIFNLCVYLYLSLFLYRDCPMIFLRFFLG
jgi:hypothetical protein